MKDLRGVLLPITTPFDSNEAFDAGALLANLDKWDATGVSGYVLLGSTGERVHLSERECLKMIEAARENVSPQFAFIVGAGQQSTQATIAEISSVAQAGADAVLVITPHYYRAEMTQAALINHYRAVADAAPVPVVLYSVPAFTNISLAPETIARLSEHENIIGVKDSSGDVLNLAETVRLVPRDFAVLTGNGSSLYPALCVGAQGAILAVALIAPGLAVAIYEAFAAGKHEEARLLQQRLTRLTRAIPGRYGISGLKAALDMLGWAGASVRAPLSDVSTDARAEIATVLKETGVLTIEAGVVEEHRQQAGAFIK